MSEKVYILTNDLGQELTPGRITKAINQSINALRQQGRTPTSMEVILNGAAQPWRYELRVTSQAMKE